MTIGENANGGVVVNQVDGGAASDVNLTLEEGRQTVSDPNAVTPESLGVERAQFDKFYNKETGAYNWQAHAKETEFKLTQKGGQQDPAEGKPDAGKEDAAREATQKAGLDFDEMSRKIVRDGDLGKEDYDALLAIGLPEEVVRTHVDNVKHRVEAHVSTVIAAFGGEEAFERAKTIARQSYDNKELDALNRQLAGGDTYQAAVDTMLAKAGLPPVERGSVLETPNAGKPGNGGVQPYSDQMEMVRDQRDPRYKSDPKFREQVYKRAAASTFSVNPRAHTTGL